MANPIQVDVKDGTNTLVTIDTAGSLLLPTANMNAAVTSGLTVLGSHIDGANASLITISTEIGSLTETAPGTDTASSGLNGRIQRACQRLTSLISLFPISLGLGGGLRVEGSGIPVTNLGDANITTAVTSSVITSGNSITGLGGAQSITFFTGFNAGDGAGLSAIIRIQTRFAPTLNWVQIARFDFTNISADKVAVISGSSTRPPDTVSALSANTVLDGILGPEFQAILTTTGTFVGANISVRAQHRY